MPFDFQLHIGATTRGTGIVQRLAVWSIQFINKSVFSPEEEYQSIPESHHRPGDHFCVQFVFL